MDVPPTAFIMGWICARRDGDDGPSRTVGTSRFALGTEVRSPRTLLCSSSGRKVRGSIHVPASNPATLRPARASGRTATPPAAPRPITATSTGFRLIAILAFVYYPHNRAVKYNRPYAQPRTRTPATPPASHCIDRRRRRKPQTRRSPRREGRMPASFPASRFRKCRRRGQLFT